jgi:hypothetical protein
MILRCGNVEKAFVFDADKGKNWHFHDIEASENAYKRREIMGKIGGEAPKKDV